MDTYTIGQVSKMVGLSAKTIRFYEESGVTSLVGRSENGYRTYTSRVIDELKLLKYARDLGLPLSEIKKLMKGCDDGNCKHSEHYIESSIDNYLKLLTGKIQKLNLLKTRLYQLKESLAIYGKSKDKNAYCCDLFQQLMDLKKRKGGENNG